MLVVISLKVDTKSISLELFCMLFYYVYGGIFSMRKRIEKSESREKDNIKNGIRENNQEYV